MNKYEEALEEVLENGGYLDDGKDDYKAPRVLKESIEKARRYDWIIEHCTPKGMCSEEIYANTLKENEELQLELEFQKEHNLENEFWLKKLYEENQILKEGIKEIFNPCNLGEPIIEDNEAHKIYIEDSLSMDFEDNDFGGVEYPYLSDGEDKIKKMLEVIKNGN